MQIAEYVEGRRRIVAHLGSAHTEAELVVLLEQAHAMLADTGQGELDLGIEPARRHASLVRPAEAAGLFADPAAVQRSHSPRRVSAPRVVGTSSRLLYDALAGVYAVLGSTRWAMRRSATW